MKKLIEVLALLPLIFVLSCSTPRPEGQTEAEVLYKEAEELVRRKRFIMASEKLNQIRSQHPYSFYATHAELLQADILFDQSNYTEAAAAYILFRDFHPRHERAAFVVWRIAESFYNQLPPTFDRDLTAGDEALKYYRELIRQHSSSEYIEQAEQRIHRIERMKINREQYVADFYFKTKVYDSARSRYLDIIGTINDQKLINHSMVRVLESSLRLKEKAACENYYQRFLPVADEKLQSTLKSVYNKCTKLKES